MIAVVGDSANVASVALHLRAGFTEIGTLKDIGFAWPLAGHGVAAASAGKRELYAAGQSGTRTLRQEKGASPLSVISAVSLPHLLLSRRLP